MLEASDVEAGAGDELIAMHRRDAEAREDTGRVVAQVDECRGVDREPNRWRSGWRLAPSVGLRGHRIGAKCDRHIGAWLTRGLGRASPRAPWARWWPRGGRHRDRHVEDTDHIAGVGTGERAGLRQQRGAAGGACVPWDRRNREDEPAKLAREGRGGERAAPKRGLHHHDGVGHRGDEAVSLEEATGVGSDVRVFADEGALGRDAGEERVVIWWVGAAKAGREHRDGFALGIESAPVGGGVDTDRASRDDDDTCARELRGEVGGEAHVLEVRGARADDGNREAFRELSGREERVRRIAQRREAARVALAWEEARVESHGGVFARYAMGCARWARARVGSKPPHHVSSGLDANRRPRTLGPARPTSALPSSAMNEPDLPAVDAAPGQLQATTVTLRYEDLAEDGRLKADVAPFAMSEACWRHLLVRHPLTARLGREGIVPILRRLIVAVDDTPLSTMAEPEVEGRFGIAVARTGAGDRFLLELAAEMRGPRGRTFSKVERAGEIERVARIYGEHVFTRLFAPPDQRRVRSLPEGLELAGERAWREPEDLLAADEEFAEGPVMLREHRFGLVHTDSNQHVNSLVYPRLFEELSVEVWLGVSGGQHGERDGERDGLRALLGRGFDVAYRKPCFAGERVEVRAQRVRRGPHVGARVWLAAPGEARPRCAARLWLR